MKFEWDTEKAGSNASKDKITFQEAASVFGDPLTITYDDPDHAS